MKNISIWIIGGFFSMLVFNAGASTVNYVLENVILDDGTQMFGTFLWTYDIGDFENGVGQFTFLDIPHTNYDHTDLNTTIDVEQSIEITLGGVSAHDEGLDISLFLLQSLTPTTSSMINLVRSKYEIGGNGFHTGLFLSGSISPVYDGDYDGVGDALDNCPSDWNPLQEDNDGDLKGDACDIDDDNDGRPDINDVNPLQPAPNFCDGDNATIGPWSVIANEVLDCRAQISITSVDGLLILDGGEALFMSRKITLMPGFSVEVGGTFTAVIATDIAN